MDLGGLAGAAFIGAKDRALDAFIDGRIGFLQMADVVKHAIDRISGNKGLIDAGIDLDTLARVDHLATCYADDAIAQAGQKQA